MHLRVKDGGGVSVMTVKDSGCMHEDEGVNTSGAHVVN